MVNLSEPVHWQDLANVSGLPRAGGANFGYSVAMTNSNALIGAPGANTAYLFSNLSTANPGSITFTELKPGSPADGYGATVALTDHYAAIGSVSDMWYGSGNGGANVYLYNRTNSNWTTVRDPNGGTTAFSSAIALNNSYLLVGDFNYHTDEGRAYLYTLGSTTPLHPFTGTSKTQFGSSVALNTDYALIGAFADNSNTGKAELYRLSDYSWAATYSGNNAGDYFGSTVALNSQYALVGTSIVSSNYVKMYDLSNPNNLGNLGNAGGLTVKSDLSAPPALAMNETYALIGVPGASGDVYWSGGSSAASNLSYGDNPESNSIISAASLVNLLGSQDVVLQANNDITVNGGITVTGTSHNLTLQAGRSISVNADIRIANGNLNIIGNDTVANGVVNINRDSGNAVITTSGVTLDAGTGNVTIELRDGIDKTNYQSGSITLGTINANTITVVNRGTSDHSDIVLGLGGTLTANGTGDAIKLAVTQSNSQFVNNSCLTNPLTANNGHWLVYSQNPVNGFRGSMSYNFKQYNLSYGIDGNSAAILGAGNGFIYTLAPIIQASLTGSTSKTYDGDTTAALTNSNYTFTGAVDGDTVDVNTSANGTYSDKNAGTNKTVTVSGLTINSQMNGSANVYGYQVSTASGNIGEITARAITFTGVMASNKEYDNTTTASISGTASLSGVLGNDALSLSGTPIGAFGTKDAGTNKTVHVGGLSLGGTDAGNYTLSPYTTTADITPKNITVTGVTANNKVYDGNTIATVTGTAGLSGVLGSDVVNVSGMPTGTFATKDAGIGKPVSITGLSLSGADAGNYTLSPYTTAADITPKALTVSLTGTVSKVHDGTIAAALLPGNYAFSGVVGSDLVQLSNPTRGTYDNAEVGSGKMVTVTGITLSGHDAGNYRLPNSTISGPIGQITQETSINEPYRGAVESAVNPQTPANTVPATNSTEPNNTTETRGSNTSNVQIPGLQVTGNGVNLIEANTNSIQLNIGNRSTSFTVARNNNSLTISMPGLAQSTGAPAQQSVTVIASSSTGAKVSSVYEVNVGQDMISITNTTDSVKTVPPDPIGKAGAVTSTFSLSANGKTAEFTMIYADGALRIKPANETAAAVLSSGDQKLVTGASIVAAQTKLGVQADNVQAVYLG